MWAHSPDSFFQAGGMVWAGAMLQLWDGSDSVQSTGIQASILSMNDMQSLPRKNIHWILTGLMLAYYCP